MTHNNKGTFHTTLIRSKVALKLFTDPFVIDRDGHGPEFLKKMNEINNHGGFNISVYHSFHDEVNHFRTHWWQCDKCQYIIKRAMNRPPGPSDWWFPKHQQTCGGNYIKIKSPPPVENKKKRSRSDSLDPAEAAAIKKPKLSSSSAPSTPASSGQSKASSSTAMLKWLIEKVDLPESPAGTSKSKIVVEELD